MKSRQGLPASAVAGAEGPILRRRGKNRVPRLPDRSIASLLTPPDSQGTVGIKEAGERGRIDG